MNANEQTIVVDKHPSYPKKRMAVTKIRSLVTIGALILFPLLSKGYPQGGDDLVSEILSHLKSSNSKELSKYFAATVEIAISPNATVCSKKQAEHILSDFFSKHQVSSLKVIHQIDSKSEYKLIVVLINTNNGSFRTTITMENSNNRFLITEIQIENNKDTSP